MEGASKHPMKSTSELPYTVGARPYIGLVYAGLGPQGPGSRLLSVYPPDLLGVDPTGAEKILIPKAAKQIDFSIIEPLTDQEKEEYYELNLYIITFVSKDMSVEPTGRVQITIKPPTAKRADP